MGMSKRINGNKVVFGFVNCAAFNRDPSGDYGSWWPTREERDAALARVRAWAVSRGLSESAAHSGIYPVKMRASRVRELCGNAAID